MSNLEQTDSKRPETILKRNEERFRALIENACDAIVVVDKKGIITYASPSVERIGGYKPDELIGKSGFLFIAAADLPRAILDFGKAVLTSGSVVPNIFRVRHKNGSELVLEGVGRSLFDDPSVSGFVMNVRDVTERKRAEEKLRQAEKDLTKSNTELREALKKLEETHNQMVLQARMSALGQMAAGIAHGFNNALMPIIGYSELLHSKPETLNNRAEALSMIGEINAAARDARHMVQRLRMIRGSADEGDHVPVDMNEIAGNAVEMTRPWWDKELGAKGIQVQVVTCLGADRQTPGDASELREALMNLILNAVDAMPDVSGDLVARAVKEHAPATPVILLTGFGDIMKDEGEHPTGMDAILSKPLTQETCAAPWRRPWHAALKPAFPRLRLRE